MNTNSKQDDRIAKMTFASVYPHYINKVTKNQRTIEELHTVIEWLTGMNEAAIQQTRGSGSSSSSVDDSANEENLLERGSMVLGRSDRRV